MFNRTIIETLLRWKNDAERKPLILRGARQVGKTTAVRMFAAQFENFIPLNLELKSDRALFHESLALDEFWQAVLVTKNIRLQAGATLLFIDEIQNSAAAMKMLRYFYEERRDVHVIAAGSLLEFMLEHSEISFPVGRVQFAYMYPLTFEEFLAAGGEEQLLEVYRVAPIKKFALPKLFQLFRLYALLGGMPEIVRQYLKHKDVPALKTHYESLLTSYLDDTDKYARNSTQRQILRHALESVPAEAGTRIKFQGFGNSNYRSREMSEALRALERAMLLYLVYPTTAVQLPLAVDLKKSPLLQFIDTGLLNYFAGLQPGFFQYADLHSIYKGRIVEHLVRQELLAQDADSNRKITFWVREQKQSNAEVDMLLPFQNYAIPVEVKSGATGTLRSLHQFLNAAPHPFAVRLYEGPFEILAAKTPEGKNYRLMNLPYFLAGRLHAYLPLLVKGTN